MVKKGQFMIFSTVIKKWQFRVVITVVKKGHFWLASTAVKKSQFRVVSTVVKRGRFLGGIYGG